MTLHGAKAIVPFCLFCIIKLFYDITEAFYEFFLCKFAMLIIRYDDEPQ